MADAAAPAAVLFDLDGTLLNTAPDMVLALDRLLAEHGHGPSDFELARLHVSKGAIGLINIAWSALGLKLEEAHRMSLRERYLDLYAERLCEQTALFDGMAAVLEAFENAGLPWGIVTNKPGFLAEPLLVQLELLPRCAVLVSGDTLSERKPHPRPLLFAAEQLGIDPGQAIYVGDDERDIVAGKAAGMKTITAAYGFIPPDENPDDWQADARIDSPAELLRIPGLNALG